MVAMGGGRGNLRVAKTPPLQSALRGDRCGYAAPIAICAHGGINGNGEWEDHDAALVREGTREWAGNSRPAPTKNALANLAIDRNVIPLCKPHINAALLRSSTNFNP